MKFELKNFLINICGWIIIISMSFFLVVFVIFSEDKVKQPFKETLTLTLSFLSALATIGAAIIAARIFQTWKTQHSYVEQIKILAQMLENVSEIQKNLDGVRRNLNLAEIIVGQNTSPNLDSLFVEQAEKIKVLEDSLNTLFRLENQIYLLNNDKREKPVFINNAGEDCPVIALLKFTQDLEVAIWEIHSLLSFDFVEGELRYQEFDVRKNEVQRLVFYVMSDGAWYISLILNLQDDSIENSFNKELRDWLRGLDQRIMKYRDSLNTLS
ncbi:hypothetical protein [Acinetobacter seifertii]|uniref:hypothetical protein n=1 Tax=Acinetobacter seifertii TaxID=1530123 RepID=UPI001903BBBC|nr:hypothetical protein [Acinetobacter seifertii]MBJ9425922.1 hypothetical protein [Acinetobacter seifertii]